MSEQWVKRWGYEMSVKPVRAGIYRLRAGGYLVRGRITEKMTGHRKTVIKALPEATLQDAQRYRLEAMDEVRATRGTAVAKQLFDGFAASLFERKVLTGDLKSEKSIERWEDTLTHHLVPAFGHIPVVDLRYADIERWKTEVAKRFTIDPKKTHEYVDSRGKKRRKKMRYSPTTANGWLSILRVITKEMTAMCELGVDPGAAVRDFDTSDAPTYTDEEPNALLVDAVPRFLEQMRADWPQHYAMTFLGFITGLRPSSLRPLRRNEDVLWDENAILVRRSNSKGDSIMNKTKTGKRQRISLPESAMQVLREHVAWLEARAQVKDATPEAKRMAESEFLFPSETGGMRSRSALDKPFKRVKDAVGIKFRLTPRGMRRTYQDLARAAEVTDIVTRAVSGHATETMQQHYSTVGAQEMRAGLAKVVDIALARKKAAGA